MKKRLLSLLLAAACLMPLSGCNWGEEPEETYDTLSQYYQQSDNTKQDTRLTSFGLPYLQGETWDPITCADGAQQTLGALLWRSGWAALLWLVYNVLGNVSFIVIQRYNRPRLQKLAEKTRRRPV